MTSRYQQVANDLREAIERGDYAPGETIPNELDLCEQYGLSRWTISQAIAILAREGLVTRVRRRGTVVRDRRLVRVPLTRYGSVLAPGGARGPWESACDAQGIDGVTEVVGVGHQDAPDDVADALGIEHGAPVVYRRRHMWARDQVAQVQEAWMPLALVDGSPLAGDGKIVGGVYGALTALGHAPATVTETVTARLPTPDETSVLGLSASTPVLALERVTRDEGGRVLELLRAASDADRVALVYDELPLTR